MRVVAGAFGGRVLIAPDGMTTRPTTDKVRQAVFNSLDSGGWIDGAAVIDLFAGSGAMGIEALSRGAAAATFVERDSAAVRALQHNIDTLKLGDRCTVVRSDAPSWMAALAGRGGPPPDIVFADPPYDFDDWHTLAASVGGANVPLLVAEAAHSLDGDRTPPGWEPRRSKRYGRTWVTMLDRII
jgi:16S rRNA (guanine966-N2)-methyltransferase